jgi:transposase
LFEQALGLKDPWYIKNIEFSQEKKRLDITIDFKEGSVFSIDGVEGQFKAHDTTSKTWRHLNFFEHECLLHARVPRVKTGEHSIALVKTPWEGVLNGFTLLMEALIIQLCTYMPVNQAAKITGISDDRLWRVLSKYVEKAVQNTRLEDLKMIGVDETSIRKGHNYITLFVDLVKKRTVHIAEGKDASTIQEFSEVLEIKGGKVEQITDISCDMSPAFIKGAEDCFNNASITFDRFHVMKIINTALDKVRKEEYRTNTVLKGTKYLFLKNRNNLSVKENDRLKEITMSQAGSNILKAYHMKECFQEIYKAESKEEFTVLLKKWYFRVTHSRLEPMIEAAKSIKRHWDGILRWAVSSLSNGILEGLNSLVQAAKKKARGYRKVETFIIIAFLITGKLDFAAINPCLQPT